MAILLITIGLLFTGVDVFFASGVAYPDYIAPKGPVG